MLTPKTFQKNILFWFDKYGRKNLPWQHNKNPYRVWLSEVMLQQTQVSTVIQYFQRFVETFPTVQDLANAHEDAVLHLWTGLGYYTRARNLHRTAKIIQDTYQGQFPSTPDELQTLPGIGRSTAGAILATAFEKKAAILDGNVKRVLTRFVGVRAWPGEKKAHDELWSLAEKYTPSHRVADYTQAMMDLGATLCTRSKPRCHACPIQKSCVAYNENLTTQIPAKKPSKTLPVRTATLLILQKNLDFVLLEKRANQGIWGGLWSLPEIHGNATIEEIKEVCYSRFFYQPHDVRFGEKFRHTFSHFHLEILPVFIRVKSSKSKVMEADQQIWYNLQQPNTVGLPAPIKTLLMALKK